MLRFKMYEGMWGTRWMFDELIEKERERENEWEQNSNRDGL